MPCLVKVVLSSPIVFVALELSFFRKAVPPLNLFLLRWGSDVVTEALSCLLNGMHIFSSRPSLFFFFFSFLFVVIYFSFIFLQDVENSKCTESFKKQLNEVQLELLNNRQHMINTEAQVCRAFCATTTRCYFFFVQEWQLLYCGCCWAQGWK